MNQNYERRFVEPQERIPEGLLYRGPGAVLVGPVILVKAVPGVVATRTEIQEELDRRRTYGIVRNSL